MELLHWNVAGCVLGSLAYKHWFTPESQ